MPGVVAFGVGNCKPAGRLVSSQIFLSGWSGGQTHLHRGCITGYECAIPVSEECNGHLCHNPSLGVLLTSGDCLPPEASCAVELHSFVAAPALEAQFAPGIFDQNPRIASAAAPRKCERFCQLGWSSPPSPSHAS